MSDIYDREYEGMPDPDELLAEAERTPPKHMLRRYVGVIHELRRKDYSFRDIAKWFQDRGLDFNHNAIYREYVRDLSPAEQEEVDREEAEQEIEEALDETKRG